MLEALLPPRPTSLLACPLAGLSKAQEGSVAAHARESLQWGGFQQQWCFDEQNGALRFALAGTKKALEGTMVTIGTLLGTTDLDVLELFKTSF